mmetsp:Transcript_17739/g.43772  ORF Transcript_17739/g.43772 Transcript_17739/m.43772 type:complete len:146 (-) Transcript_17739:213-650(-)
MAHILGFSSTHFRFFWDRLTGKPRTPRPFAPTTVTCLDGSEKTLLVPAENALQFFSFTSHVGGATTANGDSNGSFQQYAAIVTQVGWRRVIDVESFPEGSPTSLFSNRHNHSNLISSLNSLYLVRVCFCLLSTSICSYRYDKKCA